VAALIRARHPDLTPAQVRQAIGRGTTRRPAAAPDTAYGHGAVDAYRALRSAEQLARTVAEQALVSY
jgi:hypothetical protein